MNARSTGFIAGLARLVRGEIREAAPLSRYSTYRIGGPATVLHPAGPEDVAAAIRYAAAAGIPVFPLGLGSNLLLPDEGLEPLVVRLGKGLDAVTSDGPAWRLGAGLPAPLVARRTAREGWAGLHMMIGVPGTVGGGVFMNAGCHGGDWASVVERVMVVDRGGDVSTLPASRIPFSYRQSGLDGLVVLETEVRLRPGDREELDGEVERLLAWRQNGTPFSQPCCGSVFRNPAPPASPGWIHPWTAGSLLDAAGQKGTRIGGAVVSEMHANYFVNTGGATAADIRALIAVTRAAVHRRFGVTLETEVKLIAPSGAQLP